MKIYDTFETERLLLKATSTEDASLILELLNTPKWIKNIGDRNVKSLAAAETYIKERMEPQLKRLGYSNYTIIRKSDRAKMGTCGLYDREGLEGIDIGFALLPEFEKQGYAYEASAKLLDFAIHEIKIPMVQGITLKENIPSRKLLEKLGLEFQGTTRIPNDDEELMLYQFENNV